MGLFYVAALVVGLGVLLLQVVLGSHGHGGGDHTLDHGHGHGGADKELTKGAQSGIGGIVGVVLSVRFWVFFCLAFGLSGTLIHSLSLAGTIATILIASGAGASSGVFAVLAFRAVTRGSLSTTQHASKARGQLAKVLVPVGKGRVGQVRIQLGGSSMDMMATTDDEELGRGEVVLVEDVNGGVAHVSKRPNELA
jgi:membrane protein implicated in regulation of membrane protease activity